MSPQPLQYNREMTLALVAVLSIILCLGYSVYVHRHAKEQLWSWYHSLVSTFLAILLGVVAGFLVYYQQKSIDTKKDTEATRILLQQELSHLKRLLTIDERATISLDAATYRPLIIFLQPLALEKAAQSGLFSPVETANMLHIAGKIRTYNLQIQFLISVLNGNHTDQDYKVRLRFILTNLEKSRKALINDIEFEAQKLNIQILDMEK